MLCRKRSESGIIMVAVIIFVMIISVVVLGLLSRSTSQVLSTEEQARHIQAEQLRQGVFWKAHADLLTGNNINGWVAETIGSRSYNVIYNKVLLADGTYNIITNVVY